MPSQYRLAKRILGRNSLARHKAQDWRALALTQVYTAKRIFLGKKSYKKNSRHQRNNVCVCVCLCVKAPSQLPCRLVSAAALAPLAARSSAAAPSPPVGPRRLAAVILNNGSGPGSSRGAAGAASSPKFCSTCFPRG